MADRKTRLKEAFQALVDLDMPTAQRNDRSALCLLALLDLSPGKEWSEASDPLIGITPMMEFARINYGKEYAPNTRETFRRQTIHQFVQAGIAVYNPDNPNRPVNSPKAVYQIEPMCLNMLRDFGTARYRSKLTAFMGLREGLATKYAKHREMNMVPLTITGGTTVKLSAGEHSELIKSIWDDFGPRFVPGGQLVYAGDTGDKWSHSDDAVLRSCGIAVDNHGKMPDVVIYDQTRNWLVLVEAVTSHGPVDAKRHQELEELFSRSRAGLVYVSAFSNRRTFTRYLEQISWETEVWIADNPSHLIHFNGTRFLGPYK